MYSMFVKQTKMIWFYIELKHKTRVNVDGVYRRLSWERGQYALKHFISYFSANKLIAYFNRNKLYAHDVILIRFVACHKS